MQEVVKVQNVKCGGCVQAIQSGLSGLAGIAAVSVDIASGTVTVDGENLSLQLITDTLAGLGYPPQEAT